MDARRHIGECVVEGTAFTSGQMSSPGLISVDYPGLQRPFRDLLLGASSSWPISAHGG